MNILYLPIIEPGQHHATALHNKRGLYNALVRAGHEVTQYDYLADTKEVMYQHLTGHIAFASRDLAISQFHGAEPVTPDMLRHLRSLNPNMRWVNWSGDSWLHGLTGEPMLEMCRQFDLTLCAAPDVLPIYAEKGIRAEFWQIAYEEPVGELPDVPEYDIVFLGNVINESRRKMLEMLRTLPYKVGIYGDWEHADGNCHYNFGYGEALYKKAKLAIADNVYAEQTNYISNRPIQVMMAHGALLLHQHVAKMAELSDGWKAGTHYIEWDNLDELRNEIDYHMHNSAFLHGGAAEIIDTAYAHASTHHTYDCRVKQLMEWLNDPTA